jgi:hypothetical protein
MCRQLSAVAIPETVQHDDLHDGQVFVRDGRYLFFDWGDIVDPIEHGPKLGQLRALRLVVTEVKATAALKATGSTSASPSPEMFRVFPRTTVFVQDLRLPGMLFGKILRPSRFWSAPHCSRWANPRTRY